MQNEIIKNIYSRIKSLTPVWWITIIASFCAFVATYISYKHGIIVAYGDAESHLNIAKRVVNSLTPGFAQLGGIWLPLPHILLIPFVASDFLWRSGLAGSIVSGVAFVVSAIFIYKLVLLLTDYVPAAFFASLVFILNPNVLYLQSTPMTELTLIVFFVLSTYYFIRFIYDSDNILMLIAAAFFGFCASLSRYDGWGLVLMEAVLLVIFYFFDRKNWKKIEGMLILFCTLAFFGVALWLLWGGLILGDPLYFTHSPFSAKSQQESWLAQGELPAYKNIVVSAIYYSYTSMVNLGGLVTLFGVIGCVLFLFNSSNRYRFYIFSVLVVPFLFNVATLYLGQSVIFIPGLTPSTFRWDLFNVRYGVLMVPFAAVFIGYLVARFKNSTVQTISVAAVLAQCFVFLLGYAPIITLADGTVGLSSGIAKIPDAQHFLVKNYDYGLVLEDDFSRTISVVHSTIPMQNVIYIGNKGYWGDSLKEPEKYARWIVMHRDDAVWKSIYDDPVVQGRLFKYFNKVYTSEDLYVFKRISDS